MSDATVLHDDTRLSQLDRWYFKLESQLATLGGVVIFLLVLLATLNVLGRWLFNLPVSGYVDWVEQAMAVMAFAGLSYTQRLGGHIRMDIVISRLRRRLLWLVEFVMTLLMLAVSVVLMYGSYLHFLRAYQLGDSSLNIELPIWPSKLVVAVAFTIFALRLLLQLWGYGRAWAGRAATPAAVPLYESTEKAALRKAKNYLPGSGND